MKLSIGLSFVFSLLISTSAFADISLGTGLTIVQVAPGLNHSCAILNNGMVKCWGKNNYGQLGLGDKVDRVTPEQLGNNLPYVNLGVGRTAIVIAVGEEHTCALLDNATIKCWGSNAQGQLGYPGSADKGGHVLDMASLGNVDVGSTRTPVGLHLGDRYSCTTFSDRSDLCWGEGF